MNTQLFLLTLYQIFLALSFGLLTIFVTLKVIHSTILRVKFFDLVKEGNIALAIFEGVLIFCVLFLVEVSILPSVDALRTMIYAHQTLTFQMIGISFGYFLLFYAITLIFSYILILAGFYVFVSATAKLDEVQEIKQNNVAVSLVVSMVLISLTIFIKPSLGNLIHSFVDYQSLEKPIKTNSKENNLPINSKEIDEQK
jgi:uncharacterized membrane protein YjfL (UPF0719 family)